MTTTEFLEDIAVLAGILFSNFAKIPPDVLARNAWGNVNATNSRPAMCEKTRQAVKRHKQHTNDFLLTEINQHYPSVADAVSSVDPNESFFKISKKNICFVKDLQLAKRIDYSLW